MKTLIKVIIVSVFLSGLLSCWVNIKPTIARTDTIGFLKMLKSGDIKKYIIIDDRHKVNVYIKKDSLYKYRLEIEEQEAVANEKGPQFYIRIINSETFSKELADFYTSNPLVRNVESATIARER